MAFSFLSLPLRSLTVVACAGLIAAPLGAAPRALPRHAPPAQPAQPAQPAPPAIPKSEAVGDTISPPPQIAWKEIAQLPAPAGFKEQPGLAGSYAGASGLFLIIAGGANFLPDQSPDSAPRAYWNTIYVLEKIRSEDGDHKYAWHPAGLELPRAIAYGASVNIEDGLLCIGGRTVEQCLSDCFVLRWNADLEKVEMEEFPKLPVPLAHMACAKIGDTIYVLGGRESVTGRPTHDFFALDLKQRNSPSGFLWQRLAPWDGSPRLNALASSGTDGETESLYLCGGRNPGGADGEDFLTDLHRFDPIKKSWSVLGNALDPAGKAATLMGAPTFFVPPHHLVLVGGTDEKLTTLIEENSYRQTAKDTTDPKEAADRNKLTQLIIKNYPGYSRNVMAFDIVASEWSFIGHFPSRPPVSTTVVPWDGNYVIPGGETGPGQRTPTIWQASVMKKARIVE